MGIIGRIVLEEGAGFIVTTLLGVAGALVGGFIAWGLGPGDPIDEFFDISTWVASIICAMILVYAWQLARSRSR